MGLVEVVGKAACEDTQYGVQRSAARHEICVRVVPMEDADSPRQEWWWHGKLLDVGRHWVAPCVAPWVSLVAIRTGSMHTFTSYTLVI